MKMYCYKKCSTCKKAIKFLQENNIVVELIDYTEQPLTYVEIAAYYEMSKQDIKSFFNTSGLLYRKLNLKTALPTMQHTEKIELLAEHPMLIKRPLLVGSDFVLIGFKEKTWQEKLL